MCITHPTPLLQIRNILLVVESLTGGTKTQTDLNTNFNFYSCVCAARYNEFNLEH